MAHYKITLELAIPPLLETTIITSNQVCSESTNKKLNFGPE